jgi:hypothetical protein
MLPIKYIIAGVQDCESSGNCSNGIKNSPLYLAHLEQGIFYFLFLIDSQTSGFLWFQHPIRKCILKSHGW